MGTMLSGEYKRWDGMLARSDGGVIFWHNDIVRMLLAAALLPLVCSLGLIAYFIRPNEMPVVLHYNVYFGVDLLGVWWQVYALPALAIFFLALHTFLAWRFYERTERIACYLMLLSAGLLAVGILVASVSVVFINY